MVISVSKFGLASDVSTNAGNISTNAGNISSNTTALGGKAEAPSIQTFDSSGTWTKPANAKLVQVEVWGGIVDRSRYLEWGIRVHLLAGE